MVTVSLRAGWVRLVISKLWRREADVGMARSEEHTSELQSLRHLVCRLLLEKKKNIPIDDVLAQTTGGNGRTVSLARGGCGVLAACTSAGCSASSGSIYVFFFFFFF